MSPDEKKFQSYKINMSPRGHIEPEEIFFDSAKVKEFEGEEIDAGKLEKPISSTAILAFEICGIVLLACIGVFTGYIIFAKGKYYGERAQLNSSRVTPVFAERGKIYSAEGEILAENEIYFDLVISTPKLTLTNAEIQKITSVIGDTLHISGKEIFNKFQEAAAKKFSEFILVAGMSRAKLNQIERVLGNNDFFEIRQISRRKYTDGNIFSHVLGYTGEAGFDDAQNEKLFPGERIGKSGVESFYDDSLAGEAGSFIKTINSRGEVLNQELRNASVPGKNITLNIHADLQRDVREILKRQLASLTLQAGVVIVINPQSGAILALVSIPDFNANLFEQGISHEAFGILMNDKGNPMFNRAISGEYPSGSIIKPFIAAAALEEKLVTPNFLVYSGGVIHVPSVYNSQVVYEFKDWKAHGWVDMRKAIADSVNIYFYTIGGGYGEQEGLGIRKIEKYLLEFGWGKTLGVDVMGERSGLIPSPRWKKSQKGENWYIGDTYHTSIGQGDILVTPLQVAAATAVFANSGTLFKPTVVKSIGAKSIEPQILSKNFISTQDIEVVREGMRQAVRSGSSRFLADLDYAVAGKTGTAQSNRMKNHAWFTGFAPYDAPEVVITVLLEEGESSNYAVHTAKDVLQAYFLNKK